MRFGVGMDTGVAVVGNIGICELLSFTAVGDVVNLAQRLEEMAGGGEILMTDNTQFAVNGAIRSKALGPVSIRGRSESVPVHTVLASLGEERV